MEEQIRLQKYLADCGICSRRKAEELILQGKVKVNNEIVNQLGIKVNPNKDEVEYLGKSVTKNKDDKVYILLNKPIGYVTTVKDQFFLFFQYWRATHHLQSVRSRLRT